MAATRAAAAITAARAPYIDGDVVKIPLNTGKIAVCDIDDFQLVRGKSWSTDKYGYVIHYQNVRGKVRVSKLHRLIRPEYAICDHVNRDKLNCRRSNLRDSTFEQNGRNRSKMPDQTSKYMGVSMREGAKSRPWKATCCKRHLGYFQTEIEAAKAFDVAARAKYGEYAALNFPIELSTKEGEVAA